MLTPASTDTSSNALRNIWDGFLRRGGVVNTAMLQKASLTVIVPGEELSPFFPPDEDRGRRQHLPPTNYSKPSNIWKKFQKREEREKVKQQHKCAKVFHTTPQTASPPAARLGSREGGHCPQLSPDHGAGFSYVLFP